MIAVLVFYAHAIFACYAFSKSYQSDGFVQAILNVAFVVILFTVGWTISDLITGFFISENGYDILIPQGKVIFNLLKMSGIFRPLGDGFAKLLPKDSIALILLTTIEIFFYRFYFKKTKID